MSNELRVTQVTLNAVQGILVAEAISAVLTRYMAKHKQVPAGIVQTSERNLEIAIMAFQGRHPDEKVAFIDKMESLVKVSKDNLRSDLAEDPTMKMILKALGLLEDDK